MAQEKKRRKRRRKPPIAKGEEKEGARKDGPSILLSLGHWRKEQQRRSKRQLCPLSCVFFKTIKKPLFSSSSSDPGFSHTCLCLFRQRPPPYLPSSLALCEKKDLYVQRLDEGEDEETADIFSPLLCVCTGGGGTGGRFARPFFFSTPFLLLGNLISKLSPPLSYSAAPLLLLLRHLFPLSTGGLL